MIARLRKDLDELDGDSRAALGGAVDRIHRAPLLHGTRPCVLLFAAGQLMDYAVHAWDIRQGTGLAHGLDGDAADLLVPFMFVLWQSTIRSDADLTPFEGRGPGRGRNGGDFRVSIGPGGMTYEAGSIRRAAHDPGVRCRHDGPHGFRPRERRIDPRRPTTGRALLESLLPDLTCGSNKCATGSTTPRQAR